jgi:hypothetical protein
MRFWVTCRFPDVTVSDLARDLRPLFKQTAQDRKGASRGAAGPMPCR